MKIIAVVQARTGSNRLPGKVLADLGGQPVLHHTLERLREVPSIEEIILATTTYAQDDSVAELGRRESARVIRGPEDDVLARFLLALDATEPDVVVRITGDCPLLDPWVTEKAIQDFLSAGVDYVYAGQPGGYPRGVDTEVIRADLLQDVARLATEPEDREHVTRYLRQRPNRFELLLSQAPAELRRPDYRLCVDEPADLELVREVLRRVRAKGTTPTLRTVVAILDADPDLAASNVHVKQNLL